jgi:phenylacetate-CoA ligase
VLPGWGTSIEAVYDTGPCAVFSVHEDVAGQAEWLVEQDPDYLLSVPSNLVALARELQARGACLPRLREVWTYAEALSADRRAVLRRAWGVPVTDMYSTQEVGYIALQCPSGDAYHVQAESVFVEVLDDGGAACPPGQVGRVVVTPLHNYAMPLVRYAVGDYAEVGEACPCGRGLPTLSRIVGRERNMLVLPTGERLWPTLDWAHVAPNRQLQLVQRELDHIEARMVGPRPLTAAEEAAFAAAMHERFGYRFRVSFRYLERIERGPGLKFEDFVCLVGTDGRDPAT